METTKRAKTKKKATKSSIDALTEAYRTYLLTEGAQPASVFAFCRDNGLTETDFYSHFASFEALEKAIWRGYAQTVVAKLTSDDAYTSFSAREKVLSFHFTLAEVLKSDRSFVLHQLKSWKVKAVTPTYLKAFKSEFDSWIDHVLNTGKQSQEIAARPFLDTQYGNLFWMHLLFILQFWVHDESVNFEKTDMAIEKSVNLAFDLIGKGVLDNALDFGKFLYQQSKN